MNSLSLHGVTISAQNFGTRILVFLQGPKEAIEQRYYSFWNYGATGGELEWWCDNCAAFWVVGDEVTPPERRFEGAMAAAAQAELANKGQEIGLGKALSIARARLSEMQWVDWHKATDVWDAYTMGTSVTAEKGTGNFDDDCVTHAFERGASALDSSCHQPNQCGGDGPGTALPTVKDEMPLDDE